MSAVIRRGWLDAVEVYGRLQGAKRSNVMSDTSGACVKCGRRYPDLSRHQRRKDSGACTESRTYGVEAWGLKVDEVLTGDCWKSRRELSYDVGPLRKNQKVVRVRVEEA